MLPGLERMKQHKNRNPLYRPGQYNRRIPEKYGPGRGIAEQAKKSYSLLRKLMVC